MPAEPAEGQAEPAAQAAREHPPHSGPHTRRCFRCNKPAHNHYHYGRSDDPDYEGKRLLD